MNSPNALTGISLGGGVQSTVMALMAGEGAFGGLPNCSIFPTLTGKPRREGRGSGTSARDTVGAKWAGTPLTDPDPQGMMPGRDWPGDGVNIPGRGAT